MKIKGKTVNKQKGKEMEVPWTVTFTGSKQMLNKIKVLKMMIFKRVFIRKDPKKGSEIGEFEKQKFKKSGVNQMSFLRRNQEPREIIRNIGKLN